MRWAERSWSLSACSIFSGSIDAGHYIAMTRNAESVIHTLYNDEFVTVVHTGKEAQIKRSAEQQTWTCLRTSVCKHLKLHYSNYYKIY